MDRTDGSSHALVRAVESAAVSRLMLGANTSRGHFHLYQTAKCVSQDDHKVGHLRGDVTLPSDTANVRNQ